MIDIKKALFELRDLKYRDFHSRLMPNIPIERVIGVRIPDIKKLAKDIGADRDFMSALPHFYYEENNLHAFMISSLPYEECIAELDRFLPFVDNWATCDSLRPKCFSGNTERLIDDIYRWLEGSHPYAVRFAMEMLMVHFLGGNFKDEYAVRVASVRSDEYYVNMMKAWYFATALAKQYDAVLPMLSLLDDWSRNKAIQKSCESFRISAEKKEILRKLKV